MSKDDGKYKSHRVSLKQYITVIQFILCEKFFSMYNNTFRNRMLNFFLRFNTIFMITRKRRETIILYNTIKWANNRTNNAKE